MSKWLKPPVIKIYEALGAVADGRVHVEGNTAKVYSSSGNKFYDVVYSSEQNEITANDNGSYWKGYLGYPSIALLFVLDALPYDQKFAESLKNIAWKDINTKFKNDFTKTESHVREIMAKKGADLKEFDIFTKETLAKIAKLDLQKMKTSAKPPKGY